jgi:peptidoglycan/LPS O-acetylase OafA/YrhL
MLNVISLVAVVAMVVLYAAAGVLAITTGRVAPWQREYIPRPRLWGFGALLFGAGMALARYGGTVRELTASDIIFACSFLMLICGGVLQYVGKRIGRLRV